MSVDSVELNRARAVMLWQASPMTWAGRFFAVALVVGMWGASGCAFLQSDPEECFFDDDCSGDDVCIDFVCRERVTVSPCGVDVVPAGWRCENGNLLCNAPLADRRCDVSGVLADDEVCDDDPVVCRTNCGGDDVSPHCVEDEPGVGRRFGCPDGTVDASTCGCTSKCDCAPGEVCGPGGCAPAPAFCLGADDCPRGPVTPTDQCEAFQCNGFNDQCFDPDPASRLCTDDSQCVGRPGCIAGVTCTCTVSGACVPSLACTIQNDSTTCGFGNFCDGDGRCQPLPACTGPDDCTGGLVCNAGNGLCERSQPCTISTDCGVAPNTFCANNFCTVPTCTNNAFTCTAPQVCNANGRCADVACANDGVCELSQFCDLAAGQCRDGCRNNGSCANGLVCSGNRTCVTPSATGSFGDACTVAEDCAAPLLCAVISGTCAEACAVAEDCVACSGINGSCTCSVLGFCAP